MKFLLAIFVPLFVAAILASAKAIVDVEKLKVQTKNDHELLIEVDKNVKLILGRI